MIQGNQIVWLVIPLLTVEALFSPTMEAGDITLDSISKTFLSSSLQNCWLAPHSKATRKARASCQKLLDQMLLLLYPSRELQKAHPNTKLHARNNAVKRKQETRKTFNSDVIVHRLQSGKIPVFMDSLCKVTEETLSVSHNMYVIGSPARGRNEEDHSAVCWWQRNVNIH